MDEALRQQALEWFVRGDHDMETAQLLYDRRGHTDAITYHIQQALEKYLKGYLVLNGQRPPRSHDVEMLLNLASRWHDSLYAPFVGLCERATRYYLQERYPPGLPAAYSHEQVAADLDSAWQLIRTIRLEAGL